MCWLKASTNSAAASPPTHDLDRNEAGELSLRTVARAGQPDITWSATYDPRGRMATETDGVGNTTTYSYNRAGELITTDDPRAVTIERDYDGLGRQISVTSSDGTVDDTFDYNRASQMTLASNAGGDVTITYDDAGNSDTVSASGSITTLTYTDDRLSSRSDPGGTTTYGYDAAGRLDTVTDPFTSQDTTLSYEASGRLKTRSEPSGLTHTLTYDPAGRFDTETVTDVLGTEHARFERDYNASSQVTSELRRVDGSGDNGTWSYDYDDAGRLDSATAPTSVTTTYDYDAAGNRTEVTEAGSTTTYDYDAASRLASSSDGATYTHDAAGNLRTVTGGEAGGWSYDYDGLSRMTEATGPSATIDYDLDALGRTASRSEGATTTTYSYQDLSEQPVEITQGAATTHLAWIMGQPLAQRQGSATRFFGTTPHGDVAYLANTSGTITATRTYSPYGEVRTSSGEDTSLGYQGDVTDEDTDLIDMGARHYHPVLGRFTSTDPLMGSPGTPGTYGLDWYLHQKSGSEWTYIGGYRAGPPDQWKDHEFNRFFFLPKWSNVGIESVGFDGDSSMDLRVPRLEPGTYRITGVFHTESDREWHVDIFRVAET